MSSATPANYNPIIKDLARTRLIPGGEAQIYVEGEAGSMAACIVRRPFPGIPDSRTDQDALCCAAPQRSVMPVAPLLLRYRYFHHAGARRSMSACPWLRVSRLRANSHREAGCTTYACGRHALLQVPPQAMYWLLHARRGAGDDAGQAAAPDSRGSSPCVRAPRIGKLTPALCA